MLVKFDFPADTYGVVVSYVYKPYYGGQAYIESQMISDRELEDGQVTITPKQNDRFELFL